MKDMSANDQLLTEAEAAAILRIKPDTLRHWRMRRKKGPPYIQAHPHGRVLYQRSDLAAWVDAHRKATGAPKRRPPVKPKKQERR